MRGRGWRSWSRRAWCPPRDAEARGKTAGDTRVERDDRVFELPATGTGFGLSRSPSRIAADSQLAVHPRMEGTSHPMNPLALLGLGLLLGLRHAADPDHVVAV